MPGAAMLRVALVIGLFLHHSGEVSNSFGRLAGVAWLLPHVLMAGLFALAGLLAMQSLQAHGVRGFLRRRAARLAPLLLVAVMLPALVLGPIVSVRPLQAYFGDSELWSYFLNLVFWPEFTLPGVFLRNPVARIVNEIMWTLPVALASALALCATAVRPQHAVLVLSALLAGLAAVAVGAGTLALDVAVTNRAIGAATAFMLGALAHPLRRRLPRAVIGTGVAAIAIAGVALLGQRSWLAVPSFHALLALPIACGTVVAAGLSLPASRLVSGLQRYAGGLFMLGWPLQQSVIALGSADQGFVANLVFSLPASLAFAALSWHFLEQRTMALAAGGDVAVAGAAPVLSMAQVRRQLVARLPELGLWMVFLVLAFGVMALTVFAFQPDRGGI